jgi:ABC-type nickel/cobalt efflux system permease component RcnA
MKDKTLKGTVLSGLLAGANPCIDALALFIFAITIGNGSYAFAVIIFFSLGL